MNRTNLGLVLVACLAFAGVLLSVARGPIVAADESPQPMLFLPILVKGYMGASATDTASPSMTPTPSPTATSTASPSPTPTPSPTTTSTASPSATPTPSPTATTRLVPPDPASVAPAVDPGVATNLGSATRFLYTGSSPIQTGVVSGTIELNRAAVLRGRVLSTIGQPITGVVITILDHPEFGRTLTRDDGMFDLVVNGGGYLTVDYAKTGYLRAQRQAQVPWQDYAWLPGVALTQRDAQVTTVTASSSVAQVARGSLIADSRGQRQSTLFVPPGTRAWLVLPSGVTQTLASLSLRATEYTVGGSGQWVAAADGRVVKVLSVSGALADVDLDGDGSADGAAAREALGMTDAERAQLATLYQSGQSLWRS